MDEPLKGKYRNAKVFIRVFPSEKIDWNYLKIGKDKKTISCRCIQDFHRVNNQNGQTYWRFSTDGVFYNTSQKEIYSTVTKGVLESFIKGHNIIIAAFGQSGSGKSLTTLGLYNSHHDCGIAPRIIADLFSYIKSKKTSKINVTISCLEITNTRFVDLLDSQLKRKDQSVIKFVSRVVVKDEDEALNVLYKAEGRRQFADKSNYESHKANFVMTLEVTRKKTHIITSKLHVVDLAGADFYGKISCSYKELFDVTVGNLAKSQLEQFLLILCENVPAHILAKQRLNALICYLKDSLNNQSVLRFIGHIRTDTENYILTISMLRFAHIVLYLPPNELETRAIETDEFKISYLQQRVKDLETEKLLQSMILNKDLAQHMTQQRIIHLQNVAKEYLHGSTNELGILNVSDVTTFLKVFKDMYNSLKSTKEKQQTEMQEKVLQAEVSVEQTPTVKSQSGSKQSARRASVKSRDITLLKTAQQSQTKPPSPEKPTSEPKPPSSNSLARVQKSSAAGSQASIKATKTSRTGKRKSSINSANNVDQTKDQPIIPEAPPPYEQAYNLFTTSTEYNATKLLQIKHACAAAADAANHEYIAHVRRLKEHSDALEKRKCELMQAQMQKQFVAEPAATQIEYMCLQKVVEGEVMVTKQQETVLKYQTDLKIAVENHNRAKKSLNDEYDRFCMEKFKTLIPEIGDDGKLTKTIYEGGDEPERKNSEVMGEVESYQDKHERLQQVLIMEKKQTAAKRKASKKRWFI